MEGRRRLSQPSHCSKDLHPLPKVVDQSHCRDKHTTVQGGGIRSWDLTLAVDHATTRPLRQRHCIGCSSIVIIIIIIIVTSTCAVWSSCGSLQRDLIRTSASKHSLVVFTSPTLTIVTCTVTSRCCAHIIVQESPAIADKPARRLRKVCTVYVRAVGL